MGIFRAIALCALLLPVANAWSLTTKPKQLVAMEAILAELETHYGLTTYKADTYAVTLDGLREKYTRLINEAKTLEEDDGMDPPQQRAVLPPDEFRQLMIGLAAELRDGHTNIMRQDNDVSALGLNAAPIGDHLYVTEVRPDLVTEETDLAKIEAGDEILEVNAVPVTKIAQRNLLYTQGGTFEDRWDDAMSYVVINPHSVLRARKDGEKAEVKLLRNGQTYTANLHWVNMRDYALQNPKNFLARQAVLKDDGPVVFGMRGTVRSYFAQGLLNQPLRLMAMLDVGFLMNHQIVTGNPKFEGLMPVSRIKMYMVHHNGKKIGVLRIPNYAPPGGLPAILNEYRWIAQGLKFFEQNTDSLIIDQLSNTGGSVYYVTKLLSLFASQGTPLKTMLANIKLNDTYLNNIKPQVPIEKITPEHVDMKVYAEYYKELKEKWEKGEPWSGLVSAMDLQSRPVPNEPGQVFPAEEGVYTHPILLINDNKSGSGGDFFPRILQQNKRAVIMGETSCGLGGSVYRNTDSMPGSEVSFRCATDYYEGPDGWPIEGIGTVPDVYRGIEVTDIKDGFRNYSNEVLDKAVELAGGPAQPQPEQPKAELPQNVSDLLKAMKQGNAETYKQGVKAILLAAQETPVEAWKHLVIPIPEALEKDMILQTLWRPREIGARLKEMKNLPQYKNKADLIDAAITLTEEVPDTARFADPCSLRLKMKPLK